MVINSKCFADHLLCGIYQANTMPDEYFYHPQHWAVCQNHTFWKLRPRELCSHASSTLDQIAYLHVSDHCSNMKWGLEPCPGNFMGFCTQRMSIDLNTGLRQPQVLNAFPDLGNLMTVPTCPGLNRNTNSLRATTGYNMFNFIFASTDLSDVVLSPRNSGYYPGTSSCGRPLLTCSLRFQGLLHRVSAVQDLPGPPRVL